MALPESLFDVNFNPSQVSWQYSTLFLESKRMQYLHQLFRGANWMNMDWHKRAFTVGSAQPDKMANESLQQQVSSSSIHKLMPNKGWWDIKSSWGHLVIPNLFSRALRRSHIFWKSCLVLLTVFFFFNVWVRSLLIYIAFPSSIFFWMARAEW